MFRGGGGLLGGEAPRGHAGLFIMSGFSPRFQVFWDRQRPNIKIWRSPTGPAYKIKAQALGLIWQSFLIFRDVLIKKHELLKTFSIVQGRKNNINMNFSVRISCGHS